MSVLFVELNPLSPLFLFTAILKVLRVLVFEQGLHFDMWMAFQKNQYQLWGLRWPRHALWKARKVVLDTERAALAEAFATLCVFLAFIGEETAVAAGWVQYRLLSHEEGYSESSVSYGWVHAQMVSAGITSGGAHALLFGTGLVFLLAVSVAAGAYGYSIARSRLSTARWTYMKSMFIAEVAISRLSWSGQTKSNDLARRLQVAAKRPLHPHSDDSTDDEENNDGGECDEVVVSGAADTNGCKEDGVGATTSVRVTRMNSAQSQG